MVDFARALVNKILHHPIGELRRSLDGRSVPGQIEAVRRMFGLDTEATGSATAPADGSQSEEVAGKTPRERGRQTASRVSGGRGGNGPAMG